MVKVPSFNSSDEEVTDRKKIAVIESDGDERWFKKILVIRRRKWMRNRRTMQDKAAMEEIWSESQQMVQEAAVGLPYHRPRPRTLEDLLNQVVTTHKKHSG